MRNDPITQRGRPWSVFSSHGLVLLYVTEHPESTVRAASDALGLTERQITRIIKDLAGVGMVQVNRHGRRHTYAVQVDMALRHPSVRHVTVGQLLVAVRAGAVER
jgi:predicted DNA-binding transcriptional regulator YafY